MPLQNRVTPEGDIIATSARGTMMGNRGGCLHRPDKTLGSRRWVTRQWICCELQFRGRSDRIVGRKTFTSAVLVVAADEGLCAMATGLFIALPLVVFEGRTDERRGG